MADHVSRRVTLATEMIAAQTGCDSGDALQLLTVRAEELGLSKEFTAIDVLDGSIRFDT